MPRSNKKVIMVIVHYLWALSLKECRNIQLSSALNFKDKIHDLSFLKLLECNKRKWYLSYFFNRSFWIRICKQWNNMRTHFCMFLNVIFWFLKRISHNNIYKMLSTLSGTKYLINISDLFDIQHWYPLKYNTLKNPILRSLIITMDSKP